MTAFLLCLALASCGYRFPGGGNFPEGADRIFVEVLENKTSETGIENIITEEIINEFVLREEKSLANRIGDANAILGGDISRITVRTIAARGQDSANQRRVTVEVNLNLRNTNGDVIWAARQLSDNQAYPVSEDKNVTETAKRLAIAAASRRIAERALNRLTDDF
jgi:hypothetical protein